MRFFFASNKNKPCVLSTHGTLLGYQKYHPPGFSQWPHKFYDALTFKSAVKKAQAVVVASTLEYEDAVAFGIAREKIHVIPYGIEVPHQPRVETDRTSGPLHILFAGNINRAHRIELILRAARKLTVPFQITLVDQGDRPDHEKPLILQELRKLCQTLGIEDRVEFADRKSPDAMSALYEKADVFVHPAIYENFGMPLLEAAAAGLPLIASPVGVALELVTSGETGFIVPADPDTICDRLMQLSEPKTRAEFSQNLRQRARQLFGWNNVMERYLELYRQLAPGEK